MKTNHVVGPKDTEQVTQLHLVRTCSLRAVPEIILGGGHIFFSDPSTPRTHMESEPPDPQET